jgi:hypothetical protein
MAAMRAIRRVFRAPESAGLWLPVLGMLLSGINMAYAFEPQDTPNPGPVHTGTVQIGISTGVTVGDAGGEIANLPGIIVYGVTGSFGPGAAIRASVGLSTHLQFAAEAGYLDGGKKTLDLGQGYRLDSNARCLIFDATMQYRIRTQSSQSRFVPYVGVGVSTTQARADVLVTYNNPIPTPDTLLNAALNVRIRQAYFAPIAVAGVEYYIKGSWLGAQLEGKGFFPSGAGHGRFGYISAGIFFQIR